MDLDSSETSTTFSSAQQPQPYNPANFHILRINDPFSDSPHEITFTIPKRYINLRLLDDGNQGTVVSALDTVTNQPVAIKKMQLFMPRHTKRAYLEFILLTSIKHPNIINLLDAFTPDPNLQNFKEVYIVMELTSHNLHEVVHKLRLDHKTLSFFVYQMLCAIKHLHNSGVVHTDLKPSNIDVNDRCVLQVLDFGVARKIYAANPMMEVSEYDGGKMYYQAPEVILGLPSSEKVDVWSIGCIFVEMINHTVLFPGRDRVDQWEKIYSVMGTPNEEFLSKLRQCPAQYVRSLPPAHPKEFSEIVPDSNFLTETEKPDFNLTAASSRDLLANMLKINPDERYSVDDALNHPYVKLWFKEEEVNPPASENRYNPEMNFENKPREEWNELFYNEIKRYMTEHDIFKNSFF